MKTKCKVTDLLYPRQQAELSEKPSDSCLHHQRVDAVVATIFFPLLPPSSLTCGLVPMQYAVRYPGTAELPSLASFPDLPPVNSRKHKYYAFPYQVNVGNPDNSLLSPLENRNIKVDTRSFKTGNSRSLWYPSSQL